MKELNEYLSRAVKDGASDLFLVAGAAPSYKLDGRLIPMEDTRLTPQDADLLIRQIYTLAQRDLEAFTSTGDDDFAFAVAGLARFRVNTYRQRGSWAAVIRVVAFSIPDWQKVGIPQEVMELSQLSSGLVLFTGIAGCGKSTTLACLVDRINRSRACHIITLEDPIEYLHRNQMSIVSQREISVDTGDYLQALRASLRQAPDVIQLSELRDAEAIRTAMTAAETGHLVLATLHTHGAVNGIDRIIDAFPPNQQAQIRIQLSMVLRTVVSQQLLPDTAGGRVPAFEILHLNKAVQTMVRDSKNHQIPAAIAAGGSEGMRAMDQSIYELYQQGRIDKDIALAYSDYPEALSRRI